MAAADPQPTPPPWRFEGDSLTGPPSPQPHDPQSRVYSPATIVAHLPANFGGAYRYYPPAMRDANGRMLAAAWDMLRFLRDVAALPGVAAIDPGAAAVAARAREILSRHGDGTAAVTSEAGHAGSPGR
jgi:hypothetical protein